ncbi:MmcQ/YjbR family DNA-binding protein [Antarcticibacterium sp. 1MA-6-2]|uniref:MmcQ/YjbR family DNA-binding protein n=1 Tax=Antarcticibacterium sp. 1MA-6-2 TaxID=2908210 RepID=UPI001F3E8F83|nr:MmcQ/YjbR family DNA-binding protein [Antarcticibacterium sp. 1MA-6-2]UJH89913.1 MmcQ/YjbR family DNA-binding protein [Antarcticibacterium sp. 1MA-6-2]
MNIEIFRNYCLEKKGVTEELPFGPDTLVLKVMGKMFASAGLDEVPLRVNLKCDPEKAVDLRAENPEAILPGYHMNKKHWNTVVVEGSLPNSLIFELIDHSYRLVVKGLPKKVREELESL